VASTTASWPSAWLGNLELLSLYACLHDGIVSIRIYKEKDIKERPENAYLLNKAGRSVVRGSPLLNEVREWRKRLITI
jgi:hypothetical protein